MNKQLLLISSLLLLVSCNGLKGAYVDMLNNQDTIIIKGDGKFQRRIIMSNDSLLIYNGNYKLEDGEIKFMDWRNNISDRNSFTGMELDRPIFRSDGIRFIYNGDIEKGYYRRLEF